jgi:lysophospholipase L1-like esterase
MILSLVLTLAQPLVAPFASKEFALKNGDKVLFYGDSITEQQLYTTYAETLIRTRYPQLRVEFLNRGVGGDTAEGGWLGNAGDRVMLDIKPNKPDRITVMLGMNDGQYKLYDPEVDRKFGDAYTRLIRSIGDSVPNAKLTLIRTSPFDDYSKSKDPFKGYNNALLRYSKHVESLATQRGFQFVDFNAPVVTAIQNIKRSNGLLASTLIPDAIHPAESGHIIMAGALVRAWGLKPTVSSVWIDGQTGKILESENSKVSGLEDLTWTQTDGSIPFPANSDMVPALLFTDFNHNVNRQSLRITQLEAGEYELLIDDQAVGSWTARELGQGVDLTIVDTPMKDQAAEVHVLVRERSRLETEFWMRHRRIKGEPTEQAKKELMEQLDGLDVKITVRCQPKPRRFVLRRA